jgi:hypothetical protein
VFSRVSLNIPAAVPLVMWHKLATLVSKNYVLPPPQKGERGKEVVKKVLVLQSASSQKQF